MKDTDRDLLRLSHIYKSASILQGYVASITEHQFSENEMLQLACIRHLEIIGEASSKISQKIKNQYPELPWRNAIGLRNIVAHEYFRVNVKEIWETIKNDLPGFNSKLEVIINDLHGPKQRLF